MKLTLLCILSTIALLTFNASAQVITSGAAQPHDQDALLERELIERDIALHMAPIQSPQNLATYLANIPKESPLLAMSKGARNRFIQSLVFTDRGLASFQYSDLRAELSASEIYRLLSIFGVQNSTKSIPDLRVETAADSAVYDHSQGVVPLVDYYDRRCQRPATCTQSINDICIGSNCGMIEP